MSETFITLQDLRALFPDTSTPYDELNFADLKRLDFDLRKVASGVPSSQGGGQHGHLGLVLAPDDYANVTKTVPWVDPPLPGEQQINGTHAELLIQNQARADRKHNYQTYQNVVTFLKEMIRHRVPDKLLRSQQLEGTIQDIMTFLFTTYGQVDPNDLADNQKRFEQPWDPEEPFEVVVEQIEDAQEFSTAANMPFTDMQILVNAKRLVNQTGLYDMDMRRWAEKPAADQTWADFQTHMRAAQQRLRAQQRNSGGYSYRANAMLGFQQQQAQQMAAAIQAQQQATQDPRVEQLMATQQASVSYTHLTLPTKA